MASPNTYSQSIPSGRPVTVDMLCTFYENKRNQQIALKIFKILESLVEHH